MFDSLFSNSADSQEEDLSVPTAKSKALASTSDSDEPKKKKGLWISFGCVFLSCCVQS